MGMTFYKSITGESIIVEEIRIEDETTAGKYLVIESDSDAVALTADRTLTFDVNNADRTIDLAGDFTTQNNNVIINAVGAARTFTLNESLIVGDGNDGTLTFSAASKVLTVEDTAVVSQDYSSDASPSFAGLDLSADLTVGATTRVTIKGAADQDGIVFASLGTATKGIDLSSSGLSGGSDYWLYNSATSYWSANGQVFAPQFRASTVVESPSFRGGTGTNTKIQTAGVANITVGLGGTTAGLFGDDSAVGSLTDCTSNGTTTIAKSSTWGFTPTTGDLVHVIDSSTATDEGFYRVVTVNLNTSLIVDRALTGSQTDVDIIIYQDVIGFFATDGTNGQHILGYSHQDKPLVIGGDRAGTGVGTVPATGHSLGGEDIMIGGKLEVDGASYFDATVSIEDDLFLYRGAGSDCGDEYDEDGDDTWAHFVPSAGLSMRTTTADTDNAGLIKVAKVVVTAADLTASAATDNENLLNQPAGSVLLSAKFVLDTQFSGGSVSDVDCTVGLGGDENGLIAAAAHNLYSDTIGTEYTTRGAYWSATTAAGYHSASATQWIAYFTAVGDTWDNITGGQISAYFFYIDFQGT